jgi:ADP-ribose pyrophosphatase YjhB (NUDIX family)
MDGEGPFLWLNERAPPAGFRAVPKGGMCISAFLFVRRGREVLVGRYAEDARWEALTGLDAERVRAHGKGWTLPASQLKFGEDPRDTARRLAEDVLQLPGLALGEPRVVTEVGDWPRPGQGLHYDICFLVDAELPAGREVPRPPWYDVLEFRDPRALPASAYTRAHGDIVARWLAFSGN